MTCLKTSAAFGAGLGASGWFAPFGLGSIGRPGRRGGYGSVGGTVSPRRYGEKGRFSFGHELFRYGLVWYAIVVAICVVATHLLV